VWWDQLPGGWMLSVRRRQEDDAAGRSGVTQLRGGMNDDVELEEGEACGDAMFPVASCYHCSQQQCHVWAGGHPVLPPRGRVGGREPAAPEGLPSQQRSELWLMETAPFRPGSSGNDAPLPMTRAATADGDPGRAGGRGRVAAAARSDAIYSR
jgi:hypothetical protein